MATTLARRDGAKYPEPNEVRLDRGHVTAPSRGGTRPQPSGQAVIKTCRREVRLIGALELREYRDGACVRHLGGKRPQDEIRA